MSGRKRSYAVFASGSEPNLTILTADGGRVPAHNDVLRFLCSSLRNSPSSDTWDLRNLIIDDRPVTSATVTSVVEVIYSTMQAVDYKPENPSDYDIPEVCRMLLLADAVGCSRGIIEKIASLLGAVVPPEVTVTITPDTGTCGGRNAADTPAAGQSHAPASTGATAADAAPETIKIRLDSRYSLSDMGNGKVSLTAQSGNTSKQIKHLQAQAVQYIQQKLCSELELLLYVAFKLDLPTLRDRVSRFLSSQLDVHTLLPTDLIDNGTLDPPENTSSASEVPRPAGSGSELTAATPPPVQPVFSARVLAAAGGSTYGRDLLKMACLQQPLGLGFGMGTFFELGDGGPNNVQFSAVLQRDLLLFKAGSKVKLHFLPTGACVIKDSHHSLWTEYSVTLGQVDTLEQVEEP